MGRSSPTAPSLRWVQDAFARPQTLLVLGGTSEIAESTAATLIRQGGRKVVLAARDTDAAEVVAERLRSMGPVEVRTLAFEADDPAGHEAVIDDAVALIGDLDVVLLAFGVLGDQDAFSADPASAHAAVAVNLGGAMSAGLAVANRLREQGHGALVVLSSVAAERARATTAVYGGTKAGLDAFAQGLGDSLEASGARVMIVRPGFVHTAMTEGLEPAPFATDPESVAADIVKGLGTGADIVWSPAVLRWVFTVMRHLPRPLWRRVAARQ